MRSRRKEPGVCSGRRGKTTASEAAGFLCSFRNSFLSFFFFPPGYLFFRAGKGAGGGRGGEIIPAGEREGIIITPLHPLEFFWRIFFFFCPPPFSEGSLDTAAIHGSAGGVCGDGNNSCTMWSREQTARLSEVGWSWMYGSARSINAAIYRSRDFLFFFSPPLNKLSSSEGKNVNVQELLGGRISGRNKDSFEGWESSLLQPPQC